jgi:hypothetical protein
MACFLAGAINVCCKLLVAASKSFLVLVAVLMAVNT